MDARHKKGPNDDEDDNNQPLQHADDDAERGCIAEEDQDTLVATISLTRAGVMADHHEMLPTTHLPSEAVVGIAAATGSSPDDNEDAELSSNPAPLPRIHRQLHHHQT